MIPLDIFTLTDLYESYHAFSDNIYDYPADEQESSRLDGLHTTHKTLFKRNVDAPIEDLPGTRIIDLGTGSGKWCNVVEELSGIGIWAIEVADEFAHAIVKGMDLAPIQPTYLPLNCSFYVCDVTKDLDDETFPDGSVDLVHMRCNLSLDHFGHV